MQMRDDAHWRDSARTPRFFMVDAYAAFPLLLVLLHIRLWTFLTALSFTGFFLILERFQLKPRIFFRLIKSTLAGSARVSYPEWRK